jgi:sterol desaturase/sphingolipid hydroxylase (fatty acid hydroxylase superfamily)
MENFIRLLIGQFVTISVLGAAFTLLAYIARGKSALVWSKSMRQSMTTNILLAHIGGLNGALYAVLVTPLALAYQALNLPVLPESVTASWPVAVKIIVALLVYDFTLYWVHRLLHGRWLWPAHAVHHSDPSLNFMSWSRGHFTEQAVIAWGLVLTMSWLGFSMQEIAGLALVKAVHQHYVHSHLDWDHGFLRDVIVSPQFHRWHHSQEEAAWDKNFATIFPFIDRMFGTYYNPGTAFNTPTGIPDNPANDFVTQLLYPFRTWARMLKPAVSAGQTTAQP